MLTGRRIRLRSIPAVVFALVVLLICLPASAVVTRGDWWTFHHDAQHTGRSPYVGPQTAAKKWDFATGGWVESSPVIGSDGTIYVGSDIGAKVYALNPDGTKKWEFAAGGWVRSSPAIGADGTIYVGCDDNKVYALNPTGTKKWDFITGGHVDSSPAIGPDGTIYVGADDNKLYALNPDGTKKWEFVAGGWVESSPAIGTDGTIYVGSDVSNKLYALNPDGTTKWEFLTDAWVASSPAIGPDGTIYVGSDDDKVYALNPNGTKKWDFTTGGWVESCPAVASDGTIYVGSDNGKVYALNPNGTKKWDFTTGSRVKSSPAIGADGTVYVGSEDNKLYALNPDGSKKWDFTTGGWVDSSPAIGPDGTIYVGSDAGNKLYAIGPGLGSVPSLFISGPSLNSTKTGPVSYTVTYTSATSVSLVAANVTLSKTGTANGTISVSGTGVSTRTVTVSGISGDGTLGISIAAGTASNAAGSAPAPGPSGTFSVANTLPGVSISAPSAISTATGPVSYTVTYTNALAVTLTGANVTLNRIGSAFGTFSVTGTGTSTRTVTISNISGDGTLGISISSGTASNAAGNALSAGPSASFAVISGLPRISIGAPSSSSTTTGPVSYTVAYTNATTVSLAQADVTLNKTGTADGTVSVTGTGTSTRTVSVSSITGDGTLGISIAAGTGTNSVGSTPPAGPSVTFTVTNTPPGIGISDPSATSTTTGPVSYLVIYSGATTLTLAAANVTLNSTGTAGGSISVTGSGIQSRTVTISSITGDGTLGISIAAGTASNIAGTAPAAGPSATFIVTQPAPGISIGAPSASSATTGPVSYTVTYSRAASVTLASADVTVNKTGTADGTASVTGSGAATRTVTISSITGNGTLGISIAAGTASNTSGNAPAAGPSSTFTVTNTAPVVAFTFPTTAAACGRNCSDLHIAGTAVGSSAIAGVAYSLNGSPGVACTGTASWSATGITLAPGDNVLTVTATDAIGVTGTATLAVTLADATPGAAWQGIAMVSLPIIPDSTDSKSVVGFNGNDWFMFDTSRGYIRYPDPKTLFDPAAGTPGRGFWARFPAGGGASPCGTILAQDQPRTIHLLVGWNLIGQPFIRSLQWNVGAITVRKSGGSPIALMSSGDAVGDYAWGWDAVNGAYYLVRDPALSPGAVDHLAPWQAYWMRAFKECDLILPPP